MSSGVLLLRDQSLRHRHILGHPAGSRFPTPSVLQRFLIFIIIRESDNNIGWSYRKESELEIMSQSTRNGVKSIIPGFEVAASSIAWSSARAEVLEVAALQLQRVSRLTPAPTRDKVRTKQEDLSGMITLIWWGWTPSSSAGAWSASTGPPWATSAPFQSAPERWSGGAWSTE